MVRFFFFQAEDGIRDLYVTGVQTCALPISLLRGSGTRSRRLPQRDSVGKAAAARPCRFRERSRRHRHHGHDPVARNADGTTADHGRSEARRSQRRDRGRILPRSAVQGRRSRGHAHRRQRHAVVEAELHGGGQRGLQRLQRTVQGVLRGARRRACGSADHRRRGGGDARSGNPDRRRGASRDGYPGRARGGMMANVELREVRKHYGTTEVIHGVDLHIESGEFVVFVGPSGCGKSTLLRMIAGLETISDGEIRIGNMRVNEMPPRERDIAMVFQDYALYPHKTVRDNMAFGLRMRNFPREVVESRVADAAATLQIGHLLERLPKALSGGQRQRVAMGRAIVRQPKAFLFDEPLSNLDALLRNEVRVEIKKLHRRLKETVIYVTHDQVEAMTLADRIVVLEAGRIGQVGTPDQIYHQPKDRFVAGFIGSPPMNFLPAAIERDGTSVVLRVAETQSIGLPSILAERAAGTSNLLTPRCQEPRRRMAPVQSRTLFRRLPCPSKTHLRGSKFLPPTF